MVAPEAYPLHIYREDDDLILLEKPAGMTVHPAGALRSGTLVNALLHHTGCGAIQQGVLEPEHEAYDEEVRRPVGGGLFVGDRIDAQTADGWECDARVLGPSESGDAGQIRVEFCDGVVDDWDLSNCRSADDTCAAPEPEPQPEPEPEPQLDLEVCSDTSSLAASTSARSRRLERLGEGGDDSDGQQQQQQQHQQHQHQRQQLSFGGSVSDSERSGGIVRPGIVHRLDRGTTGVMVVAKTEASHAHLSFQFERRTTRRLYLAIVWGVPLQAAGRIETQVGRDPGDRLRQAVLPPGKATRYAATNYTVLASLDNGNLSVLRFALETGRTHQVSRTFRPAAVWLPFLHACSLRAHVVDVAVDSCAFQASRPPSPWR
jgi:23S rRNA-/tRNA-specific pseudouridylate synthase